MDGFLQAVAARLAGGKQGEALRLRDAAEKGDMDALFQLGRCFEAGAGGAPRDKASAALLFRMAAGQGHAGAQGRLATLDEEDGQDEL